MKKLVSIGLCTHNRVAGFKKMLDSLVNQTYTNLEIIIGDNSDNDDTKNLYETKYSNDSRIKYFKHEQNIGGIANFEFVKDNATGEYFMWAADDDWFEPTFIEKAVEKLNNTPDAVACWSKISFMDEDGKEFKHPCQDKMDNKDLSENNVVNNLIKHNTQYGWFYFYCLIRADIVKKIPIFYKNTFGHDALFTNLLLLEGKCLFIDEPLFHYGLRTEYDWEQLVQKNTFSEYSKAHCYFDMLLKMFEIPLKSKSLNICQKIEYYITFMTAIFSQDSNWNTCLNFKPRKDFLGLLIKKKDLKSIMILLPIFISEIKIVERLKDGNKRTVAFFNKKIKITYHKK